MTGQKRSINRKLSFVRHVRFYFFLQLFATSLEMVLGILQHSGAPDEYEAAKYNIMKSLQCFFHEIDPHEFHLHSVNVKTYSSYTFDISNIYKFTIVAYLNIRTQNAPSTFRKQIFIKIFSH